MQITRILRYVPGSLPWHEWELRQLLRYTLLEPSTSDEEYGFWLTQILRPHPITHQARLLYILTGPTDNAGMKFLKRLSNIHLYIIIIIHNYILI